MPHDASAVQTMLAAAERRPKTRKTADRRRSLIVALRLTPTEHEAFAALAAALEARTPGVEVSIGVAVRAAALAGLDTLTPTTTTKTKPKR